MESITPSQPDRLRVLVCHFQRVVVSGAERAILDFVKMARPDFEFVMHVPGEGPLADYYRNASLPVLPQPLSTRRRMFPGLHTLQSLRFARLVRSHSFSACIANTFPALSRVGTACRITKTPLIGIIREYVRDTPLHRRLLDSATSILAVSRDLASHIGELAPGKPVHAAHDPIDAPPLLQRIARHRAARKPALPEFSSAPTIGFIGRITPYKRPHLLIEAAPLVLRRFPDVRFVILGEAIASDSAYEREIRRMVDTLGLAHRVFFLGHRSDAIEALTELSVLCVTSTREPFPRVILESQLAEVPVVAADTGGCPEMVDHDVTGLLFNASSPHAASSLAEQIIRILEQPGLGKRLSDAALARLQAGASSSQQVASLEERILEAMDLNKACPTTPTHA
jgi:glycosyltransferase involved in cell wall biosynthesis